MGRGVTAALTGLCTAPLFGLFGFWLAELAIGPGNGPDGSIANAYLVLLIGIVAGLGGGAIVAFVATFWLQPRFRRHALVGDAILVVVLIAGWQIFIADPSPLEYDGARPALEAEIRMPQILGADAIGAISFSEGLLDSRHDDQIRQEDGFTILPWETTPYRVKAWAVQILLDGHDNWTRFDLDLPKRPAQSTDWSPWLMPVSSEGFDVVEGVSLRYRFRLIPYGQ